MTDRPAPDRAPLRRALPALALGTVLVGVALVRREYDAAALAALLALSALRAGRPANDRDDARAPRAAPESGRGLLAALPDPVILVDARGVVVDANAAARDLAPTLRPGYPLSFALRAPELLDLLPQVVATGRRARTEFGGRRAAEPTFEVDVGPLGVAGELGEGRDVARDGGPALVLTFRDLTLQRRGEQMRVDFVANVSHELRTPLASILGFVETLQGAARDDARARERFLGIILGQARRMAALIDDLLQLSRVEMRTHLPPATRIDLGATVAHMVEIMTPLADEAEVTLALERPAGPVEVVADRDEMLRVIENLVANAIKYGGSGGRVEVALARTPDGRSVDLVVRDHGPGIAPEHLPRLTERFYRVDVAQSRAGGGTGLGLAIVKHIVARHRGRLAIESEPGHGALVRVRLPIADAASPH